MPRLLKVEVREPAAAAPAAISIVVDERHRVDVAPGFDPAALRAVLEVLERC